MQEQPRLLCPELQANGMGLSRPCLYTSLPMPGHHVPASSEAIRQEYGSEFYMLRFKVERCTNPLPHDHTACPAAHHGEKARRRCPLKYRYTGVPCPDFRKGSCKRGDACPWAHGVFECWLHPSKYRTQLCNDGPGCSRPVCFFAHTASELRETELAAAGAAASPKGARAAATAAAAALIPVVLPLAGSLDKPGSGASTPRNPLDCRAHWGNSPPESEVSLSPASSFCLEAGLCAAAWPAGVAFPSASVPLLRSAAPASTHLPPATSLPVQMPERPLPASALKLQAALAAAQAAATEARTAQEAAGLQALLVPADVQAYLAALAQCRQGGGLRA